MFSNIVGQEKIISILRKEAATNSITNSMILYGNNYTGKLTTALEIARVINCQSDKSINCSCPSCIQLKNTEHPSIVLLSRRNHSEELKQLSNIYVKDKNEEIKHKINRLIKLIFLPLKDFIIENVFTETDKNQFSGIYEAINEILEKQAYTSSDLDTILKKINTLYGYYKNFNIPVNSIRNVIDWSYITRNNYKKVIIIDKIDYLEKSSSNILLKRLEEPSPDLYFILIAEKLSKIITTVRSRCRSYYFSDLNEESVNYILRKNYMIENEKYSSLADFFLMENACSTEKIKILTDKIINVLFNNNYTFTDLMLLTETLKEKDVILALMQTLPSEIEYTYKKYQNKNLVKLSDDIIGYITVELKNRIKRVGVFNCSPKNQFESILFSIKEMVMRYV